MCVSFELDQLRGNSCQCSCTSTRGVCPNFVRITSFSAFHWTKKQKKTPTAQKSCPAAVATMTMASPAELTSSEQSVSADSCPRPASYRPEPSVSAARSRYVSSSLRKGTAALARATSRQVCARARERELARECGVRYVCPTKDELKEFCFF